MTDEPWLVPYVPMKGRTFIDVGANHGTWSHWLSPGYDWVHAIEPNPNCWPSLTGKNITLHQFAAWSEYGKLTFKCGPKDCLIPEKGANAFPDTFPQEITVMCLPIDVMDVPNVDLIKIDVEGAEALVIAGARETISRNDPKLIIEIHHADNDSPIRAMLPGYHFQVIRHPFYQEYQDLYPHHYWLIATP